MRISEITAAASLSTPEAPSGSDRARSPGEIDREDRLHAGCDSLATRAADAGFPRMRETLARLVLEPMARGAGRDGAEGHPRTELLGFGLASLETLCRRLDHDRVTRHRQYDVAATLNAVLRDGVPPATALLMASRFAAVAASPLLAQFEEAAEELRRSSALDFACQTAKRTGRKHDLPFVLGYADALAARMGVPRPEGARALDPACDMGGEAVNRCHAFVEAGAGAAKIIERMATKQILRLGNDVYFQSRQSPSQSKQFLFTLDLNDADHEEMLDLALARAPLGDELRDAMSVVRMPSSRLGVNRDRGPLAWQLMGELLALGQIEAPASTVCLSWPDPQRPGARAELVEVGGAFVVVRSGGARGTIRSVMPGDANLIEQQPAFDRMGVSARGLTLDAIENSGAWPSEVAHQFTTRWLDD